MMGWKSDKDREAYISKMIEAGFDQAEIDEDVKAIDAQKSAPVAAPPPVLKPSSQTGGGGSPMTQPEAAAPSMAAAPAQSVQADLSSMKQARQDQGNSLTDQLFNLENAKLVGDALAIYGGYKLADKALEKSGLKARMFGQSAPIDRTVDIPLEVTPENKLPQAAQQPKLSTQEQQMIDRSEINRLAKERDAAARALAAGPATIPEPPEFIRKQPPSAPPAPVGVAPPVTLESTPVTAPVVAMEEPKTAKESKAKKAPKEAKAPTEEQRIAGAKNWFLSHFGGKANPEAHIAYDKLVDEVLKGKKPMMGASGGVPPEFNEFKKWYEANLQGPAKPSKEYLKAARSIPPMAAVPPSIMPQPQLGGGGGGSVIRGLTDPLQLKQ